MKIDTIKRQLVRFEVLSAVMLKIQVIRDVTTCKYLIYLLTAIGLPPAGISTIHIYTQTIHRTIQNKQYIEQHKKFWKSADRAPSWRVIAWYLPCISGKSTEKHQSTGK